MEETADRPRDSLRAVVDESTTMIRTLSGCALSCRVSDDRHRSRRSGRSAVVIPIVVIGRSFRGTGCGPNGTPGAPVVVRFDPITAAGRHRRTRPQPPLTSVSKEATFLLQGSFLRNGPDRKIRVYSQG